MNLKLERKYIFPDRVIGKLYIDGVWFCYTLEDADRHLEDGGTKVPKETCIPRGTYKVIIDDSVRYKRKMPHILDAPQFEGIRIHAGNYPVDTEGCILLGREYDETQRVIFKSKLAFDTFFSRLQVAIDKGEKVTLEVA